MSESPNNQPTSAKHQPEQPKAKSPNKMKLPDWQPLGTVRDSFYEAMKQDSRY
jgi:hypothetical protein